MGMAWSGIFALYNSTPVCRSFFVYLSTFFNILPMFLGIIYEVYSEKTSQLSKGFLDFKSFYLTKKWHRTTQNKGENEKNVSSMTLFSPSDFTRLNMKVIPVFFHSVIENTIILGRSFFFSRKNTCSDLGTNRNSTCDYRAIVSFPTIS